MPLLAIKQMQWHSHEVDHDGDDDNVMICDDYDDNDDL